MESLCGLRVDHICLASMSDRNDLAWRACPLQHLIQAWVDKTPTAQATYTLETNGILYHLLSQDRSVLLQDLTTGVQRGMHHATQGVSVYLYCEVLRQTSMYSSIHIPCLTQVVGMVFGMDFWKAVVDLAGMRRNHCSDTDVCVLASVLFAVWIWLMGWDELSSGGSRNRDRDRLLLPRIPDPPVLIQELSLPQPLGHLDSLEDGCLCVGVAIQQIEDCLSEVIGVIARVDIALCRDCVLLFVEAILSYLILYQPGVRDGADLRAELNEQFGGTYDIHCPLHARGYQEGRFTFQGIAIQQQLQLVTHALGKASASLHIWYRDLSIIQQGSPQVQTLWQQFTDVVRRARNPLAPGRE